MTGPSSGLEPWVRTLRPRQWVKNVLVAAAPLAAGALDEAEILARTVAGIVLFTGAAGAVYLLNDAADAAVDRLHPTKRRRPIAAGVIGVGAARWAAAVLVAAVVGVGAALSISFAAVVVAYLGTNIAYSMSLKHVPVVEMVIVASGFVFRAVAGGFITDIPLSTWFVAVVCAGSLFIVAGKRSAELERTGGVDGRRVLDRYSITQLHRVRAAAGGVAVIAYAMWVIRTNETIGWLAFVSLLLVTGALLRYSQAVDAGAGEEPEEIFLRDRMFQLIVLSWVAVYAGAVYG